jgi:hypothetical protein
MGMVTTGHEPTGLPYAHTAVEEPGSIMKDTMEIRLCAFSNSPVEGLGDPCNALFADTSGRRPDDRVRFHHADGRSVRS